MTNVVTYHMAYTRGTVDLCLRHDDSAGVGPLGAVSHGLHRGECAHCSGELRAAAASDGDWGTFAALGGDLGALEREARLHGDDDLVAELAAL